MSEVARRLDHSEKVEIFDDERLDGIVNKELDGDEGGRLWLPFFHSTGSRPNDGIKGPPVKDPLTMYFSLPAVSPNGDMGPTWGCTLEGVLVQELDFASDANTGALEEQSRAAFLAIASRLRELADLLDRKCEVRVA